MELIGEQILALPRERVWAALNDPDVLRASVPGCESFERVEDNHYKVVMAASVGPIKARFNGKMTLTDLQAPESYSLTFEGSGGAAGFGKGGAHVDLTTEGEGTRLSYRAHAQVGGRLAQVGARLIDGVAKKMAEDFFGRFTAAVTGPQTAEAMQTPAAQQAPHTPPAPQPQAGGQNPKRSWWWTAGLVVVIVAIVTVFRMHS
ncbi:CoxG family protein [Paraburkholderia sp. IW21]|uniref:CoxG family protein n=1 Tax=Paraburkholderia sp. IW21 TaxID=3242488 RepID=UPI0035218A36